MSPWYRTHTCVNMRAAWLKESPESPSSSKPASRSSELYSGIDSEAKCFRPAADLSAAAYSSKVARSVSSAASNTSSAFEYVESARAAPPASAERAAGISCVKRAVTLSPSARSPGKMSWAIRTS
eukprot:2096500-Prymnesium_polylepis.1